MEEKDILKRSASVLNDKTFSFEIDIIKRGFFDKLFKKPLIRKFTVRRACLGTLIYFSELTFDITADEKTKEGGLPAIIATIANDGKLMCKIIALLIENTHEEPSKELKHFIKINLDAVESRSLLVKLIEHSRIDVFMSTTILIKKMSLLKTQEMIASEEKTFGELLAEL